MAGEKKKRRPAKHKSCLYGGKMAETSGTSLLISQYPRSHLQTNERKEQQNGEFYQNLEESQLSQNRTIIQNVNPELLKPLFIDCQQKSFTPPSIEREPSGLLRISRPILSHSRVCPEQIKWFLTCYRSPVYFLFNSTEITGISNTTMGTYTEAVYRTVAMTTDGGTQPLCIQIFVPATSSLRTFFTLSPYDLLGWWGEWGILLQYFFCGGIHNF